MWKMSILKVVGNFTENGARVCGPQQREMVKTL